MSNNVIQTSFAGGELSPTLYARVDLAKYHIGAALLSNFFVDYRGGASNRPGTEFIARALISPKPVRLIPFQFSTIQNYVLEFGDYYMRIFKNGAQVLETAQSITGITNAGPAVVSKVAHGYSDGDQIYFLVEGMTQINGKQYFVASATADTFQIKDWDGNFVNSSGYGVFTSGTMARVYTVVSPYAAADLALVKFTQSADVMTLCHPDYQQQDLVRTGETAWSFIPVSVGSAVAAPTGLVVTASGSGTASYSYCVTAVDANENESVASAVVTIDTAVDIAATAGSISLSWSPVIGASYYNIYKASPAAVGTLPTGVLLGFMTTTSTTHSVDTNIVPDFTYTPPTHQDPFAGSNWPGTVTYDQQRKVYAGSTLAPETFWMSKPGQFKNFDVSNPVQPNDAITGTLVSRQVNNIKYMVSMPGGLIMLTGGGAWQVSGGSSNAVLSPTTIQATPQAYNGCADVEPITINYDILYVQQKGTVVRDLSYSFYTNIYTGADLSVPSNHLFLGYTISQWAYAEEPYKVIWAVRSDGACLSLTYLKEQEVFGWAQHWTQGRFKSVTSIQEGTENATYFVVQRVVQGQLIQFIERMHTRQMPYGSEDAWFSDCALTSTMVHPNATLTPSDATGDNVLFHVDSPIFTVGDVGKIIRAGKGIAEVLTYIDANNVFCKITRPIQDVDHGHTPVICWPQPSGTWSMDMPFTTFTGLDHLEGELVAILGDGNVFTPQVVVNGAVSISQPCSKITIGLAFQAKLQTLYLDTGEPTIQGKRKNIIAMTARVAETRGIKMGQTFSDMAPFKDRNLNTIGTPIELYTGDQRMILGGGWNTEGQMCIQQDDPLPVTVLGVIPEIQIGDTGK